MSARTVWGERPLAQVGRVVCRCRHDRASHNLRRGKCYSTVCGCPEWRPVDVLEQHPDDPGPTPPGWAEQEWCDGATCEHPECLAALLDELDEHDGRL